MQRLLIIIVCILLCCILLQVLLITVKLALPSILRFAVCVLILFMAFIFCGWLVMGPYNPQVSTKFLYINLFNALLLIQFKNPLTTAENLLSFLNGEGIDIAFTKVSWDDPLISVAVAIFNKIYLLLFIFIFIYVVLSLFIGIFDHAYDSLSVSEYSWMRLCIDHSRNALCNVCCGH